MFLVLGGNGGFAAEPSSSSVWRAKTVAPRPSMFPNGSLYIRIVQCLEETRGEEGREMAILRTEGWKGIFFGLPYSGGGRVFCRLFDVDWPQ